LTVRTAIVVALAAAIGGVVAWQIRAMRSPSAPAALAFVRAAAIAHATYSPEVRHAVEVRAAEQAHLIAWLSKRLGAPVRAPQLEPVGYSLLGGRLLPGEPNSANMPRPQAQLMYQNASGARVTLCMRPDMDSRGKAVLRSARERNVRVVYWFDGGFGYAASSGDAAGDELSQIAELAHRQLKR